MKHPLNRQPQFYTILLLTLAMGHLTIGAQEDAQPDTPGNKADSETLEELKVEPSHLSVDEVQDYMGTWDLTVEFQENKVPMNVQLIDVKGFAVALVHAIFTPEPIVVSDLTKIEDGLLLRYEADFGDQIFTINVVARLEGEALSGTFGDEGNFITADFTRVKGDKDVLELAKQAQAARGNDDGDGGNQVRNRGSRRSTRITIDKNEILVRYDSLKNDSPDHETLHELGSGDIFAFVSGRAVKLMTDADLLFGDTLVKVGNAAENYPGVYSLWLKKEGEDWRLVFNEHADIWGTQHDPSADVLEIPLTAVGTEAEEERFVVELTKENESGLLRLAWGKAEWTARFTTGQSIHDTSQ